MPTKPSLAVLNYVIGTKECWSVSKELIDGFGNCRFSVRDKNDIGRGIDFRKYAFQMPKEEGMSVTQFPLMDQISQQNAWSRIEVSVFKQEHGQIEITRLKVVSYVSCCVGEEGGEVWDNVPLKDSTMLVLYKITARSGKVVMWCTKLVS